MEQFEQWQVIDVRVVYNKKYSPGPGKLVENIHFENIEYNGTLENPLRIHGYNQKKLEILPSSIWK